MFCERREMWLIIVGTHDARIPWPVGKDERSKSLVLFGDLAKAIRQETAQAVAYWWGVKSETVWRWRRALGVTNTPAATQRRAAYCRGENGKAMRAKIDFTNPERARKISAAKRGVKRPPEVVAKFRASLTGRKLSMSHRLAISEAHKRRLGKT